MTNLAPGLEPEPSHYTPIAPKVFDISADFSNMDDYIKAVATSYINGEPVVEVCDLENPEYCEACQ